VRAVRLEPFDISSASLGSSSGTLLLTAHQKGMCTLGTQAAGFYGQRDE